MSSEQKYICAERIYYKYLISSPPLTFLLIKMNVNRTCVKNNIVWKGKRRNNDTYHMVTREKRTATHVSQVTRQQALAV